jgi:hypothetical protein
VNTVLLRGFVVVGKRVPQGGHWHLMVFDRKLKRTPNLMMRRLFVGEGGNSEPKRLCGVLKTEEVTTHSSVTR